MIVVVAWQIRGLILKRTDEGPPIFCSFGAFCRTGFDAVPNASRQSPWEGPGEDM